MEGARSCSVGDVTIVRHSIDLMKFPALYGPSLVFVVQSTKRAVFGSRTTVCDHEQSLVLATVVLFFWSAIRDKGRPVHSEFVNLQR